MKSPGVLCRLSPLPFACAALLAGSAAAQQGAYRVGDIVTNNFALPNRYLWTNDNGQVFTPGNTTWRLSDLAGKIVFLEVFAVW
jgi:hypothetical protein